MGSGVIARSEPTGKPAGIAQGAAICAAYLALAIAVTWPGPLQLASRFLGSSAGDTYLLATVLEWGAHTLVRGFRGFWDPPFYFPAAHVMANSDHLLGILPFYAPVRLVSGNPILAYNVTYLLELALCGAGGFALALHLTGHAPASFLSGALFQVLPLKVYNADHLAYISLGFVPLTLLALHRLLERGRAGDAALSGLGYAMVFLIGFYNGMYLGVMLPAFLLLMAGRDRTAWRNLPRATLALAAALIVLVLVHLPMIRLQRGQKLARTVEENVDASARPTDYLMAPAGTLASRIPWPFPDPNRASPPGKRVSYLGVVPLALALHAAVRGRRGPRWLVSHAVLTALAFVLSLGPRLVLTQRPEDTPSIPLPYAILFRYVPGFDALRMPVRFAAMVAVFAIPCVAFGAARLMPRRGPAAWGIALVLMAVHRLECWPLAYFPSRPVRDVPADPAYRDLADPETSPGRFAILEIPSDWRSNGVAMWASMQHGRPVVNGWTGFLLPGHQKLFDRATAFPSPRTIAMLQALATPELRVRRVIWRKEPGVEEAFERARRDGHLYPEAPLLADHGGVLVFGLLSPDELFEVEGDVEVPLSGAAALPLSGLEVHARRFDQSGDGITMRSPGSASTRLDLVAGTARFEVAGTASSGGQPSPPLVARILLEGTPIRETIVPWDEPFVVRTPAVRVKTPGTYELAISFEASDLSVGRHFHMSATIEALRMETGRS